VQVALPRIFARLEGLALPPDKFARMDSLMRGVKHLNR
jgi:hypothetical protein